jgi:hypothetical protein
MASHSYQGGGAPWTSEMSLSPGLIAGSTFEFGQDRRNIREMAQG